MEKPEITENMNYYGNSFFTIYGYSTYIKVRSEYLKLGHKPTWRYLQRTVKKDNKSRLYINYGPIHLYFAGNKLTRFREGENVLVDSRFYVFNVFGVTRNKKTFETWKWIGNYFY